MQEKTNTTQIKLFAEDIRLNVIRMINNMGVPGHLGGSLSIADVLAVLYGKQMKIDPDRPQWDGRDWLVVSKGHAGPAVYSALALKGYFPIKMLETLNRGGTDFPSHCDRNKTPGVDMTTGSLGQGASLAAGVATSFKLDEMDNKVFLIMGDGELNEGQIWEMALFAAQRKLSNLIAFVDYNHLQLDGTTEDICNLGDVAEKFSVFGWNAVTVDGHNVSEIDAAINMARHSQDRPNMIVLETTKGKGWREYEGRVNSHSTAVSLEQLMRAEKEIEARKNQIVEAGI